jgi:uncharacterized protein YjiS (DUF1127 family)
MDVPDCCSSVTAAPAPIEAARSATRRGWWQSIGEWRTRAASRRELARFNAHMLRDIGIDPAERWHEARKRFWQP